MTDETRDEQDDFDAPTQPTRRVTIGHRLEYAALRGIDAVLRLMSVDRASALMGRIWRIVAPHLHRHRRADRHLALAMPQLSPAERRAVLLDMWENLGRTAAEGLRIEEITADPSRFDTTATRDATALLDRGGAIFASLHQGNWELAVWPIRNAGHDVAGVYRRLTNPLAERFVLDRRQGLYTAGLHTGKRASALRIRTLVRRGAAVAMLADLRQRSGLKVDFFGHPASVTTYPAMLARRIGLPLVAGRVVRTEGVRFRIEAVVIDVPRTADVQADVEAATRALHAQFHAWIAADPGQWMWATRKIG